MLSKVSMDWSVLDRNLPRHLKREVHQCPKHGTVHLIRNLRSNHLYPCQYCEDDQRDLHKQMMDRYRDKRLEQMNNIAKIPKRFDGKKFSDYRTDNAAQKTKKDAMMTYANGFSEHPGRCMILFGNPGTGKTHLGIAVLRKLIADGYHCRYTTMTDMLATIKNTYDDSTPKSTEEAMNSYLRPAMLMIDEVGLANGTDHDKQLLYRVMNGRYEEGKAMIVATNLSISELEYNIDARLVDRLREDGGRALQFNHDSFRK